MQNVFKKLGIIVLTAVIGFLMVTCDDGNGGDNGGDNGGGAHGSDNWFVSGYTYYTVTSGSVEGVNYSYDLNYTNFRNNRNYSYEFSYSVPIANVTNSSTNYNGSYTQSGDNSNYEYSMVQNYTTTTATNTTSREYSYNYVYNVSGGTTTTTTNTNLLQNTTNTTDVYTQTSNTTQQSNSVSTRTGNTGSSSSNTNQTTRTILSYNSPYNSPPYNMTDTDTTTTVNQTQTGNTVYDSETGLTLQQTTSTTSVTNNGDPVITNTTVNYVHEVLSRDGNTITVKYYSEPLSTYYYIYIIRDKATLETQIYLADGTLYSTTNNNNNVIPDIAIIRERLPDYRITSNQTVEVLSSTSTTLELRVKTFNTEGVLTNQTDTRYRKM